MNKKTDHKGIITEEVIGFVHSENQNYEEANAMLGWLDEHIIQAVHKLGYEAETAPEAEACGSEVCGKCVTEPPCTYRIP